MNIDFIKVIISENERFFFKFLEIINLPICLTKIQKNENKKFSFMNLMINFLDIFFEFIVIERNKYITQSIIH